MAHRLVAQGPILKVLEKARPALRRKRTAAGHTRAAVRGVSQHLPGSRPSVPLRQDKTRQTQNKNTAIGAAWTRLENKASPSAEGQRNIPARASWRPFSSHLIY